MAENEKTQFITGADARMLTSHRLHCLELLNGDGVASRHVVGPLGLRIGRTVPADIVLPDTEISRAHCVVDVRGDELHVRDLNSTNGTFVDGARVAGASTLPLGSILQVGLRAFKHERRTRAEIEHLNEMDQELEKAASYVRALLPPTVSEGPIKVDWIYKPSAKLGGDAFGYGTLGEDIYVAYLIDVAGHGAGASMHAVAVMNQLRQRSLPGTDMARPDQVLSTLNALFQMEEHAGLYFTIWYGVYDARTRTLNYASGGHHPAYLVPSDRSAALPLHTRNAIIGAMPGMPFRQGQTYVAPGSSVYLFSDGVFEIIDSEGRQWDISDLIAVILKPGPDARREPQRLYELVCQRAQPSTMDDDFSLMIVTFE